MVANVSTLTVIRNPFVDVELRMCRVNEKDYRRGHDE